MGRVILAERIELVSRLQNFHKSPATWIGTSSSFSICRWALGSWVYLLPPSTAFDRLTRPTDALVTHAV